MDFYRELWNGMFLIYIHLLFPLLMGRNGEKYKNAWILFSSSNTRMMKNVNKNMNLSFAF